jgi:hypothetical protein
MWTLPEFGDCRDNASVLVITLQKIAEGAGETWRETLSALRDHIMQTGDVQSAIWLLPSIVSTLRE